LQIARISSPSLSLSLSVCYFPALASSRQPSTLWIVRKFHEWFPPAAKKRKISSSPETLMLCMCACVCFCVSFTLSMCRKHRRRRCQVQS
jgi:hypothetical protein